MTDYSNYSMPTGYSYNPLDIANRQTYNPLNTNGLGSYNIGSMKPMVSSLLDKTNSITNNPETTFGLTDKQWGGLAVGGQLLGGLTGAYVGLENLGLAKKQYALQEDMLNKQYNMAKDAYDRNVKRAEHIGNQMNRSAKVVGEANG
jgi:hypothetical protein